MLEKHTIYSVLFFANTRSYIPFKIKDLTIEQIMPKKYLLPASSNPFKFLPLNVKHYEDLWRLR